MLRRSLLESTIRARTYIQATVAHGSGSSRPLRAFPQNAHAFSGLTEKPTISAHPKSSILGNVGMKLGLVRVGENLSSPYALSFRSYIHSGKDAEVEAGRAPGYIEDILDRKENGVNGLRPLDQSQGAGFTRKPTSYGQGLPWGNRRNGLEGQYDRMESNADIVHIKLMRNNSFVTVTDSKGNKKMGTSAGKLAGKANKLGRYAGEAAAEDIGRKVRQMKTKSVVVKVNGYTFFRRKKDAILGFKDGYTNMRGDINANPIVYIEDTTRKPHNGCRLPKKRRI